MKLAKASVVVVIVAGAFGLGVWSGPRFTERGDENKQVSPVAQAAAPVAENKRAAPAAHPPLSRHRARARRAEMSGVTPVTVPAVAPELERRLKPLLNKGANMDIASQDFPDGEQFAMVAHAARNTEIPFMVLKHHVLQEEKSLADAIHEFNPALDASAEAQRARTEAKSDLAAIAIEG